MLLTCAPNEIIMLPSYTLKSYCLSLLLRYFNTLIFYDLHISFISGCS